MARGSGFPSGYDCSGIEEAGQHRGKADLSTIDIETGAA
jgi:hypothetical protein